MQSEDTLLALFTANVDERDGIPVFEVPARELELGTLSAGGTYRVAVLEAVESTTESADAPSGPGRERTAPTSAPPVEEGEQLDVEIEAIGEQGDGIARVGPGYVLFVPGADVGDRVTIEVTETRDSFGFAEVVTPEPVAG